MTQPLCLCGQCAKCRKREKDHKKKINRQRTLSTGLPIDAPDSAYKAFYLNRDWLRRSL